MELQGKVAFITGGGKRIGGTIARRFFQAGADLILMARTLEPMEEMAREAQAAGRQVLVCQGDVTREDQIQDAVKKGLDKFGRIDILVNNAGMAGAIAPVTDISLEDWNEALAVNLTSAFLCCKHVIPSMRERRSGCIINISSLSGMKGAMNRTPYCSTKWGMIGLSRAVTEEVGSYGIRVNTVCPGAVEGERFDAVLRQRAVDNGISYEEMKERTFKETPMRRMVTEEEVAATTLFLASDAASGITGAEILVSGGRR